VGILETIQHVSKIKDGGTIKREIPSGMYEINVTMDDVYLTKKEIVTDTIIDIPGSESDLILQEITQFMQDETRSLYEAYGLVYKKGFLLHGRAGTGKSVTAIVAAKKLIEQKNAIVFFNPAPNHFKYALETFGPELEGKLICLLMEEFETVYNNYPQEILSLLDGESQLSNFVTIACTNYIEQLPERIKSRPSRFSTIMEIPSPNEEVRRVFVRGKLLDTDMEKLAPIVDATDGFTIDQIKDVIISVCIFNQSISDAVMKIKNMSQDGLGEENIRSYQVNNYLSEIKKELGTLQRSILRKK
jgi:SpoVK/Ycf46/Vps4 family AAA+-type ATPase